MKAKSIGPIEKGIAIPLKQSGAFWAKRVLELLPKDSFLVQTAHDRSGVLRAAKVLGVKVTSRKINGEGYRIWRIAL